MHQVPMTRVTGLTLSDYPTRLRRYADQVAATAPDVAEQLRGDAAMLETLALSIQARMNIGG